MTEDRRGVRLFQVIALGLLGVFAQIAMAGAQEKEPVANDQSCQFGYSSCVGKYGRGCYNPAAGESCTKGLVCGRGYSACLQGDTGTCYDPAKYTCYSGSAGKDKGNALRFIIAERKSRPDMDYLWFYNSAHSAVRVRWELSFPESGARGYPVVTIPAGQLIPVYAGSSEGAPGAVSWAYRLIDAEEVAESVSSKPH